MLHQFLTSNREELISRCRGKLSKRNAPQTTERELQNGIPIFLDQLTAILLAESPVSTARSSSGQSETTQIPIATEVTPTGTSLSNALLVTGFTVHQVVHAYGDLCQAVTELAVEQNAEITNVEFHTLNRCLDNAISDAVAAFGREHDRIVAFASEQTMNKRLGVLAHEFRNLLNTSMLAIDALKHDNVGICGSTGAILDRSLDRLQDLCARTLVDVRLTAGMPKHRERVLVSEFIEETQASAAIDAEARGLEFVVADSEAGLLIEIDRQSLAGAVANLLQNAFKFTAVHGRVSLRTSSSAGRVLIEVEDECGGLPPGDPEDLFRHFSQKHDDRSGLGLGLGISRRGVEANGGTLQVRNLPGKGCVFIIDLPKLSAGLHATQVA